MGTLKTWVATPLAQAGLLDASHRRKMEVLSVTTVEELLGLIAADPEAVDRAMENTNLPQLQARAAQRASAAFAAAVPRLREERFALGAEPPPDGLSVPVYENWYRNPATHTFGFIPMPLPTSVLEGGHAMCAVGYVLDNDFTGGGGFIVRNSWGASWAARSPIEAGYGILPFEYIDVYGWEAFTCN